MSSEATVQRMPRRKWGWLFVILFVLQAIVFAGAIGTLLADAERSRSLGQDFLQRGARDCQDVDCKVRWAQDSFQTARMKESQARTLMMVAAVTSLGTLVLAFVGLRRRKRPKAAPDSAG